jgi:glutamine amidotransferase
MMTALVDYGAGNLTSVVKALDACGTDVRIVSSAGSLHDAGAIVIPGVGHFSRTATLDHTWRDAIRARLGAGVPVLGICLGMQWLFEGSEESPDLAGFGAFAGRCQRLDGPVKVPHVGWNSLELTGRASRLLAGVPPGAYAYFSHTFAVPIADETVATTTHGGRFSSVVERDGITGAQCHPEKSAETGLKMLANFLAMAR